MGPAISAYNVIPVGALSDLISEPSSRDTSCSVKLLARHYIATNLRSHSYIRLAETLANGTDPPPPTFQNLFARCFALTEDKRHQFEEICAQLRMDDSLKETYHTIAVQIFSDAINWGRILAFVAFSGQLVLHCAHQGREDRAIEVAAWTDGMAQKWLDQWVRQQGGWRSLTSYFDNTGSWNDPSSVFLVTALFLAAIGTSIIVVKNIV